MSVNQGPSSKQQTSSPWSLKIASVSGIPIRLHFTFLLFMVWLALLGRASGDYTGAFLIPAIFLCVLLHELGHALVAKRYGVNTRDITLYPIGGVAMLEGRPKPAQELWIALAGPAVNVIIAILLGIGLYATQGSLPPLSLTLQNKGFWDGLYVANVILPLFNLIPAFPMDGGRVLRSLLALNMPEVQATRIAGGIGQFFAIALGFIGLFTGNILMLLLAFFVFLGAAQEVQMMMGLSLIEGHRVKEAMITRFRTIESGQNLESAAHMLLEGTQHDFPVTLGGEVLGLLTRSDIVRGLSTDGPTGFVAGHMRREFRTISPEQPLDEVYGLIAEDKAPALVFDNGILVGMVTSENLGEFLMIQQARTQPT